MSRSSTRSNQLTKLIICAVFVAIILIMSFIPMLGGYIKIGPIEISLIAIPMSVGAVLLGPAYGAVLGLVFGLTSFYQCFTTNVLGMFLLEISPILTFVMCVPTRILAGFLAGVANKIFAGSKNYKVKLLGYSAASLTGAISNTVLFVGVLVLAFGSNESVQAAFGVDSVFGIITAIITVNALVEAVIAGVIGSALAYPLSRMENKLKYR